MIVLFHVIKLDDFSNEYKFYSEHDSYEAAEQSIAQAQSGKYQIQKVFLK